MCRITISWQHLHYSLIDKAASCLLHLWLSGLVNWMVSSQACNTSRRGRFYRGLIQRHRLCQLVMMPRSKKIVFFSVTVPKNRVGRSVKYIFLLFFCSKCVCLYMFYVDWELFPVTDWKKRVGRSVKYVFFVILLFKMWVSCMFYVDWELGGQKIL